MARLTHQALLYLSAYPFLHAIVRHNPKTIAIYVATAPPCIIMYVEIMVGISLVPRSQFSFNWDDEKLGLVRTVEKNSDLGMRLGIGIHA